jgi:hypothetical protein
MPMMGPVMAYENRVANGILNSGAVLASSPGALVENMATRSSVRCSGTNTSSTTMSLLPVPRRPTVSHTSSMTYSPRRSSVLRYSPGWPSPRSTGVPRMTHRQWSQPDEKPQRPVRR